MIIKLAQFESEISELEKEAGMAGGNTAAEVAARFGKMFAGAPKKDLDAAVNYLKGRAGFVGGVANRAGETLGHNINAVTGVNIAGKAGGKMDKLMAHLSRNKAGYAAAGLLGGAAAYHKKKK